MIFYGINAVNEALRAGMRLAVIYFNDGKEANKRVQGILHDARNRGIRVERHEHLQSLTKSPDHQGIAAELEVLPEVDLRDKMPTANRLVMFDGIQDPHNFGAALRVCEVFGFKDVIYFKGNSSGITATSIKTSSGAIFHMNLYASNLNKATMQLKDAGYSIIIMEGEADIALNDLPLPEKFCLVMGSEGAGVRHVIKRMADYQVKIPMYGKVDSLNVSCALTAALCTIRLRTAATP